MLSSALLIPIWLSSETAEQEELKAFVVQETIGDLYRLALGLEKHPHSFLAQAYLVFFQYL